MSADDPPDVGRQPMSFAPLDGIRVLDLTRVLSGPYATMLLGDLGADVVKVEQPDTGDETRSAVTYPGRSASDEDYFYVANRNKRSICLDLKDPDDLGLARRLATQADVVIENFRPGVTERLGLDAVTVRQDNPAVIYCSVSGFGQTGPRREQASYDGIIQAMSGLMSLTGERDGPPMKAGVMVADLAGALFAVVSVFAGLEQRRRSGGGTRIDVSLQESLLALLTAHAAEWLATETPPGRWGTGNPNRVPSGAFKARDGSWVQLMASTDRLWSRLCDALEVRDLLDDPRFATAQDRLDHREAIHRAVQQAIRRWPLDEVLSRLVAAGVPAGPILDVGGALRDVQVVDRDFVGSVEHPRSGPIRQLGFPATFDGHRPSVRLAPPQLGEHRDEVLRDWLGGAAPERAGTCVVDVQVADSHREGLVDG